MYRMYPATTRAKKILTTLPMTAITRVKEIPTILPTTATTKMRMIRQ